MIVSQTQPSKKFNCILLIDDDGVANFNNYRLIKKFNITDDIQYTMNGKEGLSFLEEFAKTNANCAPELIFLDLDMPFINGYQFLSYYQSLSFENKHKVKIVVLVSNASDTEYKSRLQDLKIDYIYKPLTESKLVKFLP